MRGVIIGFSDQQMASKVRDIMIRYGINVRGIAHNGSALLRLTLLEDGGGLVICGSELKDMTAYQLFTQLSEDFDVLVLSAMPPTGFFPEEAMGLFYLSAPVFSEELAFYSRTLLNTRQMPIAGYKRDSRPKKDVFEQKTKRSPEEERDIQMAKMVLIDRRHFSEEEAHRYLQKESMQRGLRMATLARQILDIDQQQKEGAG
ncbi:MAG TPA: ANTAR domain-containing protein [Clostridiaceae bacterium]|jgi:response regulator NasT|nr:ANTAR domain-containing protein [Clostridiaceae bacterium]